MSVCLMCGTHPKVDIGRRLFQLVIEGDPLSKQRPRFAIGRRGKPYTPKPTKEAEDAIGWWIKTVYRADPIPDATFRVELRFFTATHQRRDLDNMCKLVFDACNGLVWKDDAQVVQLEALVTRADPHPRTELAVFELPSNRPMKNCEQCKKSFRTFPSWTDKKFCSQACFAASARRGKLVACAHCGTVKHRANYLLAIGDRVYCSLECKSRHNTVELTCEQCKSTYRKPRSLARRGARFCSRDCYVAFWVARRATTARGICVDCGGATSDKRRKRCMPCHLVVQRRVDRNVTVVTVEELA